MGAASSLDLDGVVDRLRETFDPELVFLYGSRSRDDAAEGSDVDLLVVVAASEEPAHRRARRARRAVGSVGVPVDVKVVTEEEFERRSRWLSSVEHAAAKEGEVLYRAPGRGESLAS